jgi:hypothetical protein
MLGQRVRALFHINYTKHTVVQSRFRSLPRRWLTSLAVAAVVTGVAATLIAGRLQLTGPGANGPGVLGSPLTIDTRGGAGLACPTDAAFSPDGARIVVLGSLSACAGGGVETARARQAAAIYDSATGAVLRVLPLDPLLGDGATSSSPRASRTTYFGLGWAPDGARFAVVFTDFGLAGDSDERSPENVLDSGLLVVNANTGVATVIRGDSGYFTAPGDGGFPIWDASAGGELPAFQPPPGLAYAWNADGTPYPILPLAGAINQLPAGAGPRYPVGNPDGGPRFTLWQPGVLLGAGTAGLDASHGAFVTAFPAWSQDGAHVTLMTAGVALADSADAPPRRNQRAGSETIVAPALPMPTSLPVAPARDAAIQAVQRQADTGEWTLVAWNPDGTLLGSVDCFAMPEVLEVRDTATGALAGTAGLRLAAGDSSCQGAGEHASGTTARGAYPDLQLTLAWAPSGDRLLVTDRTAGTLTLWRVRRSTTG